MILEDEMKIAFWIFIFASITDIFDGYLARKLKIVTEFGKILDPVSDKILIFSILIALSYKSLIELPIVVIIVLRDFIILLGAVLSILLKKKINYSPLKIGKITFFFQIIFVGMLLCNYANFFDFEVLIKYFGLFIIYLTFISGILYLIRWLQEILGNL
jgi:cardiolipin synthase